MIVRVRNSEFPSFRDTSRTFPADLEPLGYRVYADDDAYLIHEDNIEIIEPDRTCKVRIKRAVGGLKVGDIHEGDFYWHGRVCHIGNAHFYKEDVEVIMVHIEITNHRHPLFLGEGKVSQYIAERAKNGWRLVCANKSHEVHHGDAMEITESEEEYRVTMVRDVKLGRWGTLQKGLEYRAIKLKGDWKYCIHLGGKNYHQVNHVDIVDARPYAREAVETEDFYQFLAEYAKVDRLVAKEYIIRHVLGHEPFFEIAKDLKLSHVQVSQILLGFNEYTGAEDEDC